MNKAIKIIIFLILTVLLAFLIFFGILVWRNYQDIQQGKTSSSGFTSLPSNVSIPTTTRPPTVDDDPSYGNKDAKVTVIEFGDFQCPNCKKAAPDLRQIMEEYRDRVFFVYRDFPISQIHPEAQKAAEAAQCSNEAGKFWDMHDLLFEAQDILSEEVYVKIAESLGMNAQSFSDCLDSGRYANEVKKDYYDGLLSGVAGTPTFFVNDQKLPGVASASAWRTVLDKALAQAK